MDTKKPAEGAPPRVGPSVRGEEPPSRQRTCPFSDEAATGVPARAGLRWASPSRRTAGAALRSGSEAAFGRYGPRTGRRRARARRRMAHVDTPRRHPPSLVEPRPLPMPARRGSARGHGSSIPASCDGRGRADTAPACAACAGSRGGVPFIAGTSSPPCFPLRCTTLVDRSRRAALPRRRSRRAPRSNPGRARAPAGGAAKGPYRRTLRDLRGLALFGARAPTKKEGPSARGRHLALFGDSASYFSGFGGAGAGGAGFFADSASLAARSTRSRSRSASETAVGCSPLP